MGMRGKARQQLFTLLSTLLARLVCVEAGQVPAEDFYKLQATDIHGNAVSFSNFRDTKTVVITNVASECGYTDSHYADYKYMQRKHKDVTVVAFPCNQFGKQEPGSAAEIKAFAESQGLAVNEPESSFKLMEKSYVNGPKQHPVYSFLKKHTDGAAIQWNFLTKFVVQCDAQVCTVKRHDTDKVTSTLVGRGHEL
mmetsp:Transcript_40715/g.73562  ORF Transcript_40715/g.73562 Transcript_40715/m.73562 type:complete len:195 (-) Transcript_40715:154-738(-)